MKVQEIKNFLIMVMDKEMEEEARTTNNKNYIANCIEAKRYLMDKKGIMALVTKEIIKSDIKEYLEEE